MSLNHMVNYLNLGGQLYLLKQPFVEAHKSSNTSKSACDILIVKMEFLSYSYNLNLLSICSNLLNYNRCC